MSSKHVKNSYNMIAKTNKIQLNDGQKIGTDIESKKIHRATYVVLGIIYYTYTVCTYIYIVYKYECTVYIYTHI